MQDSIGQILSYVWGAWRFRWLALSVAWAVAFVGWLFVQQMPNKYVATARIHVDSNSVLRPLLQGLAIQPNVSQRITMMSKTLLSRPNLEKLTRMTDLDLQVQSDQEKEELLSKLREVISLSGSRENESLYSIEVQHEDRNTAKRIAQALITVFIESSLSNKREASSGAQDFLDEQIADYEIRLVEAESRLASFKQRYAGTLPGEGGGYYKTLGDARANLKTAQLQLRELENRRDELYRQIEGEEPVFLSSQTGSIGGSPLDARIAALNSRADQLLTRYTEKHPEVVRIRSMVNELEQEKQLAFESALADGQASAYAGITSSPVYQGMRSMLAETEAQIASLSVRVNDFQNRVKALEGHVNNLPLIEAELKQLDRDYRVVAEQHQQLLARRESARLSQDVEQNASDVTFRVVDPPFVPFKPSEPNKLILNTVVLIFSLGLGGAIALLVSLIKPMVADQRSLTKLTGLPLLGSVTLIPTDEYRRKEKYSLFAFASLTVVLMLAFVGINLGQSMLWI